MVDESSRVRERRRAKIRKPMEGEIGEIIEGSEEKEGRVDGEDDERRLM